ncbi:MAG: MFS transporter [Actinomycetales bacterium]|nr:MFS transporter [Actinomycetales bacterium]
MADPTAAGPRLTPRGLMALAVALVLVALNLRTTVASLPPLLAAVREDIPLTGAVAGLLTATPVLCMAWLAPPAVRIARRWGAPVATLAAVVLISVGNGLRGLSGSSAALLLATLVAGAGVATAGVVVPAVVKDAFPGRAGAATGGYAVAMMLGAATSATFSAPLANALGSWRGGLSIWALPAAAAAVLWAVVARRLSRGATGPRERPPHVALPWRSRPAWLLVAFMSAQSALAYAYLGWLAPAYVERGWSGFAAGALVGVNNLAQLGAALVLPALADRIAGFRRLVVGAVSLTVVGTAWFWLLPDAAPWLASVVLGAGLGAGFALGLTRIVHYAADAQASSRLTALVFLVSYTVAAAAPVAVGVLHDTSGGFALPFGLLVLLSLTQWTVAGRLGPDHIGTVR